MYANLGALTQDQPHVADLGTALGCRRRQRMASNPEFMSAKEIEEAKNKPLGKNQCELLGTPDFLKKEDLLNDARWAEFTRPEVAIATGQLQNGRKLLVRAPNESVQQLADTCG